MVKSGKNITIVVAIMDALIPTHRILIAASLASDNPTAKYELKWTDESKWFNVVSITDYEGETANECFRKTQAVVAAKGGSVVYFPAGVHTTFAVYAMQRCVRMNC